jgi:hypothetical protein
LAISSKSKIDVACRARKHSKADWGAWNTLHEYCLDCSDNFRYLVL